ncbi:hypothetical protein LguiB_007967 [Lonicera macranthoides]
MRCSWSRMPFMEDRISELPEDILVMILSLLTMKETARTSILSHMWKNLWTFFTGSLEFDGLKVLQKNDFSHRYRLSEPERVKFVSWVNKILNAHKGAAINELKGQELPLAFYLYLSQIAKLELDLIADMEWLDEPTRDRKEKHSAEMSKGGGIEVVSWEYN